jgi:GTPase
MKFVDEATIWVAAGKGGDGCLSFLREKNVPKGGPDGGNGGDGGSVFLLADSHLNTLVDFRHKRRFGAQHGESGRGRMCAGKMGEDLVIKVPVGTLVKDVLTDSLMVDLDHDQMRFCVAQGGRSGVGNAAFKSSVHRAPRRTTPGQPGEGRELSFELKLLADVGLLGLPNAGKSTLIRAISAAKPKVADYPFTTLVPNLGVVRLDDEQSFVLADIPGLVPGAAQGVGLGLRFLRHLSRTRLLLHMVDVGVGCDVSLLVEQIQSLQHELSQYDTTLAQQHQWLVFNKIDLMVPEEIKTLVSEVCAALSWSAPHYTISAIQPKTARTLCWDIMRFLQGEEMTDTGTSDG